MNVKETPRRLANAFSDRTPWQPDTAYSLLGVVIGIILLPNLGGFGLATEILILGLFGISFNILFGFTGLLSFGQALFFGGGAYFAAMLILEWGIPIGALLFIVAVVGGILAVLIGVLALRLSGVYFAMITLAVAQLGYEFIFVFADFTGGSQGVGGIYRPSLLGLGVFEFQDAVMLYVLVAMVSLLVVGGFYLLTRSTFGRAMRAINENPERTEALGVDVYRIQVTVFGLSGFIGALAGGMWALYLRFVSPQMLFWSYSGDTMFYTLLGGMNSVIGPIAGAGLLQFLERVAFQTQSGLWNITIGVLFVFVVLFARGGLIGVLRSLRARYEDSDDSNDHATEVSQTND